MPAEPKTYKRKSTQFKPLTAMQEAYCQSYIKTPENQTQAAINAGFSPNTAAVKASVMMRDERIQKRIAELMEERNKRMRVSADYVLMRLVEIDQMDVIDILNDDGSLKPIREWPKIWRTTLSGFDLSSTIMNMNEDSIETILKKIKWPDKVKNLELIGKHVDVNAFKERLDVNVNVTIADRIAAARKRLKERQDGNGKGAFLGAANLFVWATMFGYISMQSKLMLKGQTPRPADAKTFLAAASQGGGLGILGDFMFGEVNRMGAGPVTSLMGPAASNADSIITLLQQTTRGDADLGDWYRTALDNTPFLNVFWLRTAMNGLILNRIQDALDPGSLERYQRRVEREQGNDFLIPPSQFMLGK